MKSAIFIGWLEPFEELEPIALFNMVTTDLKYPHGTTVDVATLLKWMITVPPFPSYDRWLAERRVSR